MSDTAISIKDLSKVYKLYDRHKDRLKEALHPFKKKYHRPFYALKNIDLEVKKGEILGIVGRNGAGKSTLLKIISGVLTPSRGQCLINGEISAILELGTGFNPELTGIENIYLNGTINGISRKEMDAKMDSIVSFAEIDDFIGQPLKTYSNGMKSRLGFALAVHLDPNILILDEVLAVGDELFKRKCYAKMEELFNAGCTVLFVSHSIGSVNDICSRAIFLDKGELLLEGPAKMVTIYYQKLLHAQKDEQSGIREEILQLNNDEEKKKKFAETINEDAKTKPANETTSCLEMNKAEIKQIPFYIKDYKPESMIVSKSYDVDIDDISIKTLEGETVNALVFNEEYVCQYTVTFNIPVKDVTFAMIVRSIKGVGISGARIPGKKQYIERANTGDAFHVKFRFICTFLPRSYVINVDVKGKVNGEECRLVHINDALAFKVQDFDDNNYAGLVKTIASAKVEKI
jgi:lipopolysaccharide transport system ATP-binding protein